MGGATDTLTNALDPGHFILKNSDNQEAALLQQQQAELKKQQDAEAAKEAEMNRRRMADMRAQAGGGWGGDATG
jgi:hypothetical protein